MASSSCAFYAAEAFSEGYPWCWQQEAGAARLAPNALIARSRRTVIVVARKELALVDPQLTIEEMQLFYAGMSMRWVTGAGRQRTSMLTGPFPCRSPAACIRCPARPVPIPARTTLAPAAAPVVSRSPRRGEAQGAPAVMSSDAAHLWARRRTYGSPGRRLSSSRWQSAQAAIWVSVAVISLAGRTCKA